jgi:hypothetical protein
LGETKVKQHYFLKDFLKEALGDVEIASKSITKNRY